MKKLNVVQSLAACFMKCSKKELANAKFHLKNKTPILVGGTAEGTFVGRDHAP